MKTYDYSNIPDLRPEIQVSLVPSLSSISRDDLVVRVFSVLLTGEVKSYADIVQADLRTKYSQNSKTSRDNLSSDLTSVCTTRS